MGWQYALATVTTAFHTARIPKSSAIRIAAFSPIAIAVLYVFAPTFPGAMLQSKKRIAKSRYFAGHRKTYLPLSSTAFHTRSTWGPLRLLRL